MSEGDNFEDELLALVNDNPGNGEKKRKLKGSSNGKSVKRRKQGKMDTDSGEGPESEEEETNLYPLEGKYKDESDRQRLLQMSEVEREDLLSQRQEEFQRAQDKKNLDALLREQSGKGADSDSVSKAAKRQHALKGATKEKTRKLDELKARRKAKDEKKKTKTNSPNRSPSPMDMETSDEEEEEGQYTKTEEAEERERRILNKANPDEEPINMGDLEKCRLSRDMLVKFCMAPWFEEFIKGAWVRYLIGEDDNEPIYRICEITNLGSELVRPYKMNEVTIDQGFELRHGRSLKIFLMDKVSNSPFCQKEFDRLVKVYKSENVKLPSKRTVEKKAAHLTRLLTQPMTEADISAMLARKNLVQSSGSNGRLTMEKSRLTQARTLAVRRQDWEEVKEIDAKLEEFTSSAPSVSRSQADSISEKLAAVNERNRKANLEAVRKAELLEVERRRERKLAAAVASGITTPQKGKSRDPKENLKKLPKMLASATGTPRVRTPMPGTPEGLSATPERVLPTFESSVVDSVDVDLGDF